MRQKGSRAVRRKGSKPQLTMGTVLSSSVSLLLPLSSSLSSLICMIYLSLSVTLFPFPPPWQRVTRMLLFAGVKKEQKHDPQPACMHACARTYRLVVFMHVAPSAVANRTSTQEPYSQTCRGSLELSVSYRFLKKPKQRAACGGREM